MKPIVERVTGKKALARWEKLTAERKRWPVMLGEELPELLDDEGVAALLRTADQLHTDLVDWDGKKVGPLPNVGAVVARLVGKPALTFTEVRARLADAPRVTAPPSKSRDPGPRYGQRLRLCERDEVTIALLPVESSWQAPALLPMGWEYVDPSQLAAHLRRLSTLFGVELVGMSHELVELKVARPPRDLAEAERMSRLLLGPDEGASPANLIGRNWLSLWWD